MNDKPNAVDVGKWDQAVMAFKDMAKVSKAYYEAQVEAGFNPEQSLRLTIAYLNQQLNQGDK